MNKGIQKILSVVQTEGMKGASERIRKSVLDQFGLRTAETLCYKFSIDSETVMEEMTIHPSLNGLKIKLLTNFDEFRNLTNLPTKMNFLPIEEWFLRGAICFSTIYDLKVIAYSWLHKKQYYIENMGTFFLKEKESSFGPAFTERVYRRKGLYHLLVISSLRYCLENGIKHIYSTSSIGNTPSIRGLVRCGFKVVGCVRSKRKKEVEILEFTREDILSQRLQ